MNAAGSLDQNVVKSKRGDTPSTTANVGHTAPIAFFLRSEAEMERSINDDRSVRGDRSVASMADSSFGVQSLEDTMSLSHDSAELITRSSPDESGTLNRKRKPGNPVHPKIYATGQRIVSSEHSASPSSLQYGDSPSRNQRRSSIASSTLTPLNLSPHPEAFAGTPRSSSIRSLRLSDEEASVGSENSQAIHSSSEEEFQVRHERSDTTRGQQFVMPSISVPKRRPFTQRGRDMGQFTMMIFGENGTGKTSLIHSILRICEDVVHVDGMGTSSAESATTAGSVLSSTRHITEVKASTKPYPEWWSDAASNHSWWSLTGSGGGVLERNLCFVDTPGLENGSKIEHTLKELDARYLSAALLENMTDSQLLALMSGRSNGHIDIVLYLVDAEKDLSPAEANLLRELSRRTNVLPLISRCDAVDSATLATRREELSRALKSFGVDCAHVSSTPGLITYAISSSVTDGDIMDASTLMASDYLPALAPSDLEQLVHDLLEPNTIARLRNKSLIKFLKWRRQHVHLPDTTAIDGRQTLRPFPYTSPAFTSTGSISDEPSKVLVPHAYSSYYRSTSPSGSDASDPGFRPSLYQLPQHEDDTPANEPSRHMHIAKWARDLRQSLRREGKHDRPLKGRLGGELAVIDPRDPLGILSLSQRFRRRGWVALQIVGGCGLLGAAVYWCARSWVDWQEWAWPGQGYLAPIALPAPTRSWLDNFRIV